LDEDSKVGSRINDSLAGSFDPHSVEACFRKHAV
jgi:hypothetical protein